MSKIYERLAPSNHIQITAFPASAAKGDFIKIGSLTGIVDFNVEAGESGSVNAGKPASVFQGLKADLTGAAAVGSDVYLIAATGKFTLTATSNTLVGTITGVYDDVFTFVKV
ncbi:MAG: DUF2190 family protein [Spirochaetaceae bacterium]|jgi:predicted RecA/RadA family phage recombinase|nr:DUF2190 family protein [Spirochaetaceae bacterium]